MPERTITLTDAEAQAVAVILENAMEQDHDTVEGDYFWFLLGEDEIEAHDAIVGLDERREAFKDRFDEIRASVTSVIEKASA